MGRVVVIGSVNTDLVFRTDKLPKPGETLLAKDFFMVHGGKGANQSSALARAGEKPIFICKVGNDFYGSISKQNLIDQNISADYMFVDEVEPSGVAMIIVDAQTGQNSIMVAPGANSNLTTEDIKKVEDVIKDSKILLVQLEIPIETVFYSLKTAKANNIQTVLNPAPAFQIGDEVLKLVDIITPNETEAEILTGINPNTKENIMKAANILIKKVCKAVIITLGDKGCFYLTKDGKSAFIPAQKVNAADTTAAGDVFNGYLVSALLNGKEMPDAIEFANAAAAISVTRKGAQPSIPAVDEVHNFLINTQVNTL